MTAVQQQRAVKRNVDERRAEILEAACRVIIERGFGAARIADVANELNISTGLVHYHFDSKEQLLSEAFQFAAQKDLARLAAELSASPTPTDKLLRIISLYVPEVAESSWMLWIDGWGEALRNPTLRRISEELDITWKQHLENVFREGVATGDFICPDPHATAWRLGALVDGLSVQVTVHDNAVRRDELRRWVLDAATTELGLPAGALDAAVIPRDAPSRARTQRA